MGVSICFKNIKLATNAFPNEILKRCPKKINVAPDYGNTKIPGSLMSKRRVMT